MCSLCVYYIDKYKPTETKKSPATIEVTGFIDIRFFLDMKFKYIVTKGFRIDFVVYLKPFIL